MAESILSDLRTLTLRRSPNQYFAAPAGYQSTAQPHVESHTYDIAPADLCRLWCNLVEAEPRVTRLEAAADGLAVCHVQRSALMRYPDFVVANFVSLDDGRSSPVIYSRSRYGYSDLGVNARRVERWLELLNGAVAAR